MCCLRSHTDHIERIYFPSYGPGTAGRDVPAVVNLTDRQEHDFLETCEDTFYLKKNESKVHLQHIKLTEAFAYNTEKYIKCLIFGENKNFIIYIADDYENMRDISDVCREAVAFNANP